MGRLLFLSFSFFLASFPGASRLLFSLRLIYIWHCMTSTAASLDKCSRLRSAPTCPLNCLICICRILFLLLNGSLLLLARILTAFVLACTLAIWLVCGFCCSEAKPFFRSGAARSAIKSYYICMIHKYMNKAIQTHSPDRKALLELLSHMTSSSLLASTSGLPSGFLEPLVVLAYLVSSASGT